MWNVLETDQVKDELEHEFSLAMEYIYQDICIDLQIKCRMKVQDMYPALETVNAHAKIESVNAHAKIETVNASLIL